LETFRVASAGVSLTSDTKPAELDSFLPMTSRRIFIDFRNTTQLGGLGN
jgi:hypothetical protein